MTRLDVDVTLLKNQTKTLLSDTILELSSINTVINSLDIPYDYSGKNVLNNIIYQINDVYTEFNDLELWVDKSINILKEDECEFKTKINNENIIKIAKADVLVK